MVVGEERDRQTERERDREIGSREIRQYIVLV